MAGVVVLDAGALIALHDSDDAHHEWAMQMFREIIIFDLAMSVLTYAEALVHPTRAGKAKRFDANLQGLGVQLQPLETHDGAELAKLRVKSGLKMPDAVVLQLALKLKASIATPDKGLAQEARKLSVGVFQPS